MTIVENGRAGVFHRHGMAVATPKNFVINAAHSTVLKGRKNWAVVHAVIRTIGMAVVNGGVDVATYQLLGFPAQDALCRRVHKSCATLGIHTVNALTGSAENQLVFALYALKHLMYTLPLQQPKFVMALVASVYAPVLKKILIAQAKAQALCALKIHQ